MLDLRKTKIHVACPNCEFTNVIRLRQVELEQEIICEGCLETIQLKDANKSTAKAIDAVEGALEGLDEVLKRGFR